MNNKCYQEIKNIENQISELQKQINIISIKQKQKQKLMKFNNKYNEDRIEIDTIEYPNEHNDDCLYIPAIVYNYIFYKDDKKQTITLGDSSYLTKYIKYKIVKIKTKVYISIKEDDLIKHWIVDTQSKKSIEYDDTDVIENKFFNSEWKNLNY